jgi:hypothetical protein
MSNIECQVTFAAPCIISIKAHFQAEICEVAHKFEFRASGCIKKKLYCSTNISSYLVTVRQIVPSGWVPFGVIGLLLALVVVLFPKQLPRAAQREMAAIAAGETVITTKERSFNGKQHTLGHHKSTCLGINAPRHI